MQHKTHLLLCFVSLLYLNTSWPSFPEFFGTSPRTSSLGGQPNDEWDDPSNNYYAAALTAFSHKINVNLSYDSVKHDFLPINGIVTKNSTNNAYGTNTGNINTDYGEFRHSSVHLTLPIAYPGAGNIAISLFSPLGHLIETNTGHPTHPEYVMYHARYKRTELFANYAHPIGNNFALSLGAFVGFQVRADMSAQASLNGVNFGSSSSAKAKVSPSLASLFSIAKKWQSATVFFAYQQEMTSNLDANIIGDTSDPPIPFDIGATSIPYYDPHILRLGYQQSLGPALKLHSMLEYQLWGNYKTPVIRIIQRANVKGSDNYENIKTQNILIPKLGLKYSWSDYLALMAGVSYRPTPLKGDFSGAGNSIDTDVLTTSAGIDFKSRLLDKLFTFSGAFQWHQLKEKKVTKTSGQENGSAGQKIGSPGYTVGGDVYMASVGISTSF